MTNMKLLKQALSRQEERTQSVSFTLTKADLAKMDILMNRLSIPNRSALIRYVLLSMLEQTNDNQ